MITLFLVYFFNLDSKMVAMVYKMLAKKFDKANITEKL